MRRIALRGEPFYLHDKDALSDAIIVKMDYWEADLLDYVSSKYPYHKTVLDIGANIGNHTVYFARYLKLFRRIIALEPDEDNFAILSENSAWTSKIFAINLAASNTSGYAWLYKNRENFGAHELRYENEEETFDKVGTTTIDSLMYTSEPVSLIKIDAEWSEPRVLEGAKRTIELNHPLILVEDFYDTYGTLPELQNYELEKRWEHHHTSLYRWKDVY